MLRIFFDCLEFGKRCIANPTTQIINYCYYFIEVKTNTKF